jgi:hypothetical protein
MLQARLVAAATPGEVIGVDVRDCPKESLTEIL